MPLRMGWMCDFCNRNYDVISVRMRSTFKLWRSTGVFRPDIVKQLLNENSPLALFANALVGTGGTTASLESGKLLSTFATSALHNTGELIIELH